MKERFTMRAKPFFIGLSAGMIAGLTAAIFTAPQNGNQLRANMKYAAKNVKTTISELNYQINDLKNAVSKLSNEAKITIPKILVKHAFHH